MMQVDWSSVAAAVFAALSGVGGFLTGRQRRSVVKVTAAAEGSVIEMMRAEVLRLSLRVTALEGREGRLIRHVYRLEGLMTGAGMQPPPFEIDGGNITPVGMVAPQ